MKTILSFCALSICGALTLQAADEPKKTTETKPAESKPAESKTGEGKRNTEEQFKKLDTNGDGFISKDEFMAAPFAKKDATKAETMFKTRDKDGDGKISKEEWAAGGSKKSKGDKK